MRSVREEVHLRRLVEAVLEITGMTEDDLLMILERGDELGIEISIENAVISGRDRRLVDRKPKVSEYLDERYSGTKTSLIHLGSPEGRLIDEIAVGRGYHTESKFIEETDVDPSRNTG